jgi:O-antigen/teichoic acid export membrane protein
VISLSAIAGRVQATLQDSISGELLRGSVVSLGVRVVGLALGFLSHMLISRMLGAESYGLYAIAIGWAMILVIPARMGLDMTALRYATVYLEEKNLGAFKGLIGFSVALLLLTSALMAAILLIQAFSPTRLIDAGTAACIAAIIFPLSLLGVFSALMRTARMIFAAQFYEQALRPIGLILGVLAFAVLDVGLSAETALMLTAASTAVALGGIVIHFLRSLPSLRPVRASYQERRQWLALSWPLLTMGIIQEILNQIDILMVGYLADPSSAGHFAAAWRLASLVPFALIALSAMGGPLIAWGYQKRDFDELARIARLIARWGLAFSMLMALALALVGPFALRAFGDGFDAAYPALLILLVGGIANAFTGSVGHLMTMTGHQTPALGIFSAALLLNLILNFTLIPFLGINGAAIASSAGLTASNFLMLAYVRWKMGIDASAISVKRKAPSPSLGAPA